MSEKTAAAEAANSDGTNNAATVQTRGARGRALGKRKDIESLALLKDSTIEVYQNVYKEVFGKGALPSKTKHLIAIAAASVSGCEGCLVGHLRKAKALGATPDEIKETVAVALSVNAAAVVDRADVAASIVRVHEERPTPYGDSIKDD